MPRWMKNRHDNNNISGGRQTPDSYLQMNCAWEFSLGTVAVKQEEDGPLAWCDITNLELVSVRKCFAAEIADDWKTSGTRNTAHTWLEVTSNPIHSSPGQKSNVFPLFVFIVSTQWRCALFCFIHLVVFVKMGNMRSISYYGMAAKGLSFMLLWLQGLAAHCGFLGLLFALPANTKPEQVSSLPVCRVSLRSLRGILLSPTGLVFLVVVFLSP